MPLDPKIEQNALDWLMGGAAPSQPAARWISFATASPTSQSAFDGPFNTRNTVTFAGANSPQMSATNLNNMTLVTATAAATAVGWNLWDAAAAGNRLAFGTCTAAIGCKSADNISIATGALKITLS
jgi:hypothetical protein